MPNARAMLVHGADGRTHVRQLIPLRRAVGQTDHGTAPPMSLVQAAPPEPLRLPELAAGILDLDRAIKEGTASHQDLINFVKIHATIDQLHMLISSVPQPLYKSQEATLPGTIIGFLGGAMGALVIDRAVRKKKIPLYDENGQRHSDFNRAVLTAAVIAAGTGIGAWVGRNALPSKLRPLTPAARAGIVLTKRFPSMLSALGLALPDLSR